MLEARTLHATVAAGPFVFAFGGWNGQHELRSSCEVYDSRTNTYVKNSNVFARVKLKTRVHT